MDVQQARAFVAVARELHFGRAAESLGIAQPPLSRAIKALEHELGAPLFQRTTRTVSLTAAGRALLEPARQLIESERAARDAVHRAVTGQAGLIRFGFSTTSSKSLAARLVAAVRREHPGIEFELHTSVYAEEGIAALVAGDLDLALVRFATPPAGITGRPVLMEHPAVGLPAGHRLAARTRISVSELAGEDFVMLPAHPSSSLRETTLRLCLRAGFTPNIVQEAPDSQTVTALVSAGLGVTITSDSVATATSDSGMVSVPVDDDTERNLLFLAHSHGKVQPTLATVLDTASIVLPTLDSTT